jgi:hypothetical protein
LAAEQLNQFIKNDFDDLLDGFSSSQTCWPSAFSLTEAMKSFATL